MDSARVHNGRSSTRDQTSVGVPTRSIGDPSEHIPGITTRQVKEGTASHEKIWKAVPPQEEALRDTCTSTTPKPTPHNSETRDRKHEIANKPDLVTVSEGSRNKRRRGSEERKKDDKEDAKFFHPSSPWIRCTQSVLRPSLPLSHTSEDDSVWFA